MTESIPTTWNDDRDGAFFGITASLTADGFTDDTVLVAAAAFSNADVATQIEKVLEDLVAAESWESMAMRSATRSPRHPRDLVPVSVPAHRRSDC